MPAAPERPEPLLAVENLETVFDTPEGEVRAVGGIGFSLAPGASLGVVGESGAGKSQVFLSVMGLLASNGRARGSVRFRGEEILGLPPARLNRIRGQQLAMIFQDPMTSLNPYLTVRRQLTEVLVAHRGTSEAEAANIAADMLARVGIPDARRCLGMYPHELSGGMRQRVMIAIALLCQPELLIADEPTTALDVTIQAQILELIAEIRAASRTAVILITHDLGVVAGLCERVLVMYAGRVVEEGGVEAIFADPQHPYTAGLLRATPRLDAAGAGPLATIAGQPPNLQRLPAGCAFRDRCAYAMPVCAERMPALRPIGPGRAKACHLDRL